MCCTIGAKIGIAFCLFAEFKFSMVLKYSLKGDKSSILTLFKLNVPFYKRKKHWKIPNKFA